MTKNTSPNSQDLTDDEGPDPVDIHVGERLKLRRNLVGMSQTDMGKALGITFQQIQKYERASSRISASRLHQISKLLNVPVAWFFEEFSLPTPARFGFGEEKQAQLEDMPAPDVKTEILNKKDVCELIRAYDSIQDPKQRRTVLDLVKSMAKRKE